MNIHSAHEGGSSRDFPPGFLWGTATASYQIEGAADGRRASVPPSGTPIRAHRARYGMATPATSPAITTTA